MDESQRARCTACERPLVFGVSEQPDIQRPTATDRIFTCLQIRSIRTPFSGTRRSYRKPVVTFHAFAFLLTVFVSTLQISPAGAVDYDGIFSIGYDKGGDTLVDLAYTSGRNESIRANEGLLLSLGFVFYNTPDLVWQTQVTGGAKYMIVEGSNGEATLNSYAIDAIQFFNAELIRVGAGLTYHANPTLRTYGAIGGYGIDLDNAFGLIGQVGFRPRKQQGVSFDVRYTRINYSGTITRNGMSEGISGRDGNSIGFHIAFIF
jgi:hypothetical protein